MKKTLSINLGGSVFNIDEDAYQLLEKYLNNLRIHFSREEGADEIMDDFEARISELFNERIRLGYQVISFKEVEEVIARMGKPEELFDDDKNSEQKISAGTAQQHDTGHKRLMRDPDNKILGGVAGGLAAYMGWDATAIRIGLLLLLVFSVGYMVPLYLLCWIVIPLASTVTEKLEMRGENITVENIGKTITDGLDNVGNSINEYDKSDKTRTSLQRGADTFVQIIGFILKFIFIVAGIILLPIFVFVLFGLVVSLIALIVGGSGFLYHLSPYGFDFINETPIFFVILGGIGFFLAIGIPIFYIGYMLCLSIFKTKPLSDTAKWTLVVIWIISLVLITIYAHHAGITPWRLLPFGHTMYRYSYSY